MLEPEPALVLGPGLALALEAPPVHSSILGFVPALIARVCREEASNMSPKFLVSKSTAQTIRVVAHSVRGTVEGSLLKT